MERGQRVKHGEYGIGTVRYIMFEGTFRETYIIEFDESHEDLHDGFGMVKEKHGYCCGKRDLVIAYECE